MKKAARRKKETIAEIVTDTIIETVMTDEKEQKKMKRLFSNKPLLLGIIIILLIIIGAGGVYAFLFFSKDAAPIAKGTQLNATEIQKLVDEVGEKIMLPKGETPTIATVTDVEKLSSQPFFRNAQNGDKVLIIGSTKEAILYRTSIHKIITMAPMNVNTAPSPSAAPAFVSGTPAPSSAVTPSPSVTPVASKIKVAVLNSTKTAGLAKKGAALFNKDKYEVVVTSNAKGEYATTTVSQINKTSVKDADLKAIIAMLLKVKATVKTLPADEVSPAGADVVVILGSDFSGAY